MSSSASNYAHLAIRISRRVVADAADAAFDATDPAYASSDPAGDAAFAARTAHYAARAAAFSTRGTRSSAGPAVVAALAAVEAASYAVGAAADAASSAAIWANIRADCSLLEARDESAYLIGQLLWLSRKPDWLDQEQNTMRTTLQGLGAGFDLWQHWYDRRFAGRETGFTLPREQDLEMHRRLVTQDNEWWERDPSLFNSEIQGWIDELTPPAEPESQSGFGLTFRPNAFGVYEDDQSAGSDELLQTPEACDRHGHLADTLQEAAQLATNHNQAASLAPRLTIWSELLGHHPREMRLGRMLQYAELTLKLAEALSVEMRGAETFAQLPDRSRTLVALLEALPDAHWAMVNFDPAVARRVPLKNDPDSPQYPGISIGEVSIHIERSVIAGVLTASAGNHIMEMGEGLVADAPDPRRELRFWETVKNLPRAFLAALWQHKTKVAGAIGASLIPAAKFLITYEEWVRSLFADNPSMLRLISQLIEWLKTLPFLG